MIGTELAGRYRIEAELGSGGVGTVYRGVRIEDGRAVAIKVLRPELSGSVELRQRFEREARALAALSHPNIVSIVDSGVSAESAYLVMDLLEGETLASRLRSGPLALGAAVPILRQLLEALVYVHDQGVVHRDVKPANVFLELAAPGQPPHVRLLDFGLAKFIAPETEERALTRAGQVFGTPSYMAPEQIAGQTADARADVYAAGIVFFEMLSGAPPFRGNDSEILRQHVIEDLPVASLPSESAKPGIVALLVRATAKTRAERFPTAQDMLAALGAAVPALGRTGAASDATSATDATLEAPASSASGGARPPRPADTAKDSTSISAAAFRFVATIGVVVSLAAMSALAYALYVFVTPGHERERRLLENELSLPPPKPGLFALVHAPSNTVSPPAISAAPAAGSASLATELAALAAPAAPTALAAPVATGLEPASAVTPPPAPSAAAPAAPPINPHEPAANPWVSVPPELSHLVAKVNHGKGIEKRELVSVHQYNAKHATDPRGHLLLARGYLNRHWLKDAAAEYAIALEVNPGARGDPRMLPDLVHLVAFGSNEAIHLVTEAYADTAVPAVDRALVSPPNPEAKSRLERLKSDLSRKPP